MVVVPALTRLIDWFCLRCALCCSECLVCNTFVKMFQRLRELRWKDKRANNFFLSERYRGGGWGGGVGWGGRPWANVLSGSCVIVSAWSSCIRLVTALRRVSLVWASAPLLQLNLPCHYCSRAACLPACLPHCPWMADVSLPALSPPKDDWNVGGRQKLNVMIQAREMFVFECTAQFYM